MSTFTNFSALPKELRDMIWHQTAPTVATLFFSEDEHLVTHISAPPSLTTTKEAQTTALSWKKLTKYPIWGPEDWEDLYFDAETMILQLIINPTTSKSDDASNITWTDIWSMLEDALIAVRKLHVVCSKPGRLARLFMSEEGEYVGVGQSCVESGLFNNPESVLGKEKPVIHYMNILRSLLVSIPLNVLVRRVVRWMFRGLGMKRFLMILALRLKFSLQKLLCLWKWMENVRCQSCSFTMLRRRLS
jgi:hypothetical protein